MVHEKVLIPSFYLDFKLSQSGQEMNMPLFLQSATDCHTCNEHKISKIVTSPIGRSITKNSTIVRQNKVLTSISVTLNNNISLNEEKKELNYKSCLIYFRSNSLLQQRLKMRLLLLVNEAINPIGSLIHVDFVFHVTESARRRKSSLDIFYSPTSHLFSYLRRSKYPSLDSL